MTLKDVPVLTGTSGVSGVVHFSQAPGGSARKGANNSGVRTGLRTRHGIQASTSNGISMDAKSMELAVRESDFVSTTTNGYGTTLPGKSPQMASGLSVSIDSGSMDSPSLCSDSIMVNTGTNSAEARTQIVESLVDDLESPDYAGGRKKKRAPRSGGGEKSGRGLRQFSMKVCEKVETKGRTTYNEVADELVAEFLNVESMLVSPDKQQYDEKNIRRRVYDALNVLMAMDIISKEKKEIQWKGLPSTAVDDIEPLKMEHMQVTRMIEMKEAYLKDLEELIVGIQNLIERNDRRFQGTGIVPLNGVALPFILVETRPHATVQVEISEDMQLVHFDFNSTPFKLHDDAYVLKKMRFCDNPKAVDHDMVGHGSQPERQNSMIEEENTAALFQCNVHHASPHTNSAVQYQLGCPPGKSSAALPLPAILKARVKHENYT